MNLRKHLAGACFVAGLCAALPGSPLAETLKIGVIAPLTGGAAAWGMITAEGPKILAAELNAKGGVDIGGKKYDVQVIAYDDQYKAADAIGAYNRLVNQDGVRHMFIFSSAATLALKQRLEDDKVVAFTVGSSSKLLDAEAPHLFRVYAPPQSYLPSLAEWMRDNLKEQRIALVNPNDEAGWDQGKATERALKQNGFEVLASDLFERTQVDFQPLLTRIIAMNAEMIDLGSAPPATASLIIRQGRELGYKGRFIKLAGGGEREIIAGAGKEASEGMISLLYVDTTNAGYQRVAAAYSKSIGQEPNVMVAILYDAANVLVQAIQAGGDPRDTARTAAAFARVLPQQSLQGDRISLGGPFDRQIMTTGYICVIKDGEPVIVGKAR